MFFSNVLDVSAAKRKMLSAAICLKEKYMYCSFHFPLDLGNSRFFWALSVKVFKLHKKENCPLKREREGKVFLYCWHFWYMSGTWKKKANKPNNKEINKQIEAPVQKTLLVKLDWKRKGKNLHGQENVNQNKDTTGNFLTVSEMCKLSEESMYLWFEDSSWFAVVTVSLWHTELMSVLKYHMKWSFVWALS